MTGYSEQQKLMIGVDSCFSQSEYSILGFGQFNFCTFLMHSKPENVAPKVQLKNLINGIKNLLKNSEFDEKNQDELQQSGNSFQNEISVFRGSVQISNTERFQPVVTDDNQSKHLLNFLSQDILHIPEIPQYDNQLESHLQNALILYIPQK
ncbi:unnamed protein product (macronuclear) [Paramecium tetraurelia]|uniref:Uncharacterized protein n=1 Tax=Paramecium tetraurelia TaxID=5888 RepID=A0CBR3_PARTE|nr:uncharacterized protein GSPATT00037013001 [Paramecium tetraurelia]CAK68230.1 unnamed protein product [Paramecium tetraurelia]|eukprot:XP_001435627.1 hypothetical protein (macronuclear) [Paramecium tetraurelia strain d4-2]